MSGLDKIATGGVYHSIDSISNLKIHVSIRKASSSVSFASFQSKLANEGFKNSIEVDDSGSESYTFSWQERVFSKFEIVKYESLTENATALDKKYQEDIKRLKMKGFPTHLLYSYVEHDRNASTLNQWAPLTTNPGEQPTFVANKIKEAQRLGMTSKKQTNVIPRRNIVVDEPPAEHKARHFVRPEMQRMWILADMSAHGGGGRGSANSSREGALAAETGGQEGVAAGERRGGGSATSLSAATRHGEVLLCVVEFDRSNGTLSIRPDFNHGNRPYLIDVGGGKGAFEYIIHHASPHMSLSEVENQRKAMHELSTRHQEVVRLFVGDEFETVGENALRLVVNGEIVTARYFEYDNLYIQYFLDLPHGWQISPDSPTFLCGLTQVCQTKPKMRDSVAYFSHPFEFDIAFNINQSTGHIPRLPIVYFEVLSSDSWTRFRTEGYGYVAVPNTSGCHKNSVKCWRPVGQSIAHELRRFFIGGSPELEDLTFAGIPATFEDNCLGKYGFRTEATGELEVRMNVIRQCTRFLEADATAERGSAAARAARRNANANLTDKLGYCL